MNTVLVYFGDKSNWKSLWKMSWLNKRWK